MNTILRCLKCNKPHEVYNMYCGDQSLCGVCREDLEKEMKKAKLNYLNM
jgi:hypothetical protein